MGAVRRPDISYSSPPASCAERSLCNKPRQDPFHWQIQWLEFSEDNESERWAMEAVQSADHHDGRVEDGGGGGELGEGGPYDANARSVEGESRLTTDGKQALPADARGEKAQAVLRPRCSDEAGWDGGALSASPHTTTTTL
jgi:hypothetical protein